MSENMIIAIFGGITTLVAGLLAAWVGVKHERTRYENSLARDLGRIEGRSGNGNSRTAIRDEVPYMLGELVSSVRNLRTDIGELRTEIDRNRDMQTGEHQKLRAYVEEQVSLIKVDIGTMSATIKNIATRIQRRQI